MEELKKNIQDRDHNNDKTFEECGSFIKSVIEYRHHQVMNRQRQKFEKLEWKKNGHSNQGQDTCIDNNTEAGDRRANQNNWVINLSSTPLTKQQERLCPGGLNLSLGQGNLQLESTLLL